jgi:hypothetical protein
VKRHEDWRVGTRYFSISLFILFFYLIFAKKSVKLLKGMARGSGARPRQCNLLKAARYGGLWCVKFVSGDTM